jgi:ABC-type glutathione transport system ATPase component
MLEICNLCVKYKDSQQYAADKVSFTLDKGSFTGLVGESGSGKSTIINAILGLLSADAAISGEIKFNGEDVLKLSDSELRKIRWKSISLVPQGALNSFTPVLSIGRHISEVLSIHMGITGSASQERISLLLESVGLDAAIKDRYPHELSGGQKQRAAIALALACSPSLLLADEPTTALDVITQSGILKLLAKLKNEMGLTVLLVTHDLPMAASVCDELLVMKDGIIVEKGLSKDLVAHPNNTYTQKLIAAMTLPQRKNAGEKDDD